MNYLSLFSGIGGFEYGIQQSNKNEKLNNIGYSEIDKYAENIYRKHFPDHPRLGDATKINAEELPDFDLLVGGFPCQAFSVAGKRRGFDDTRGTLFFEIARILKEKKPKYFLLENVKGLLSNDKGRTFQTMLGTLAELGYDAQWQVYNSKDHGVPQNRERVYIKGFLRTRAGCGREVLSIPRNGTKINSTKLTELTKNQSQGARIYDSEGLSSTIPATMRGHNLYKIKQHKWGKDSKCLANKEYISPTLCAKGQQSEGNICIQVDENVQKQDDEHKQTKIKIVGNVYPSRGQNGYVYDSEGIVGTLGTSHGGKGGEGKKILVKNEQEDTENPKINIVGNVSKTGKHGNGNVVSVEGISPTLLSRDYKDPKKVAYPKIDDETIMLKNNTKKGYLPAKEGDGVVLQFKNARGRVQEQTAPTMTACGPIGTVTENLTVRKLTPKECERLQGFPDDWTKYGADGSIISDTQRYKCCGNAVTTNVITYIMNNWNLID